MDLELDIRAGDSLEIIPTLGKFDFAFADPPFNIGQSYADFSDNMADTEFENYVSERISCTLQAARLTALHGPDDLVETYISTARSLGYERVAWIIWHYRFGQNTAKKWVNAKCHCLLYALPGTTLTWNPQAVLVDSDRVLYKDKRIHKSSLGGKRVPGDVWGVPSDGPYWGRVTGNSQERSSRHPNQLPLRYLQRLIRAYTNPGDRILDPFLGSGTTGLVAHREGRHFVGIDISPTSADSARNRIQTGFYR